MHREIIIIVAILAIIITFNSITENYTNKCVKTMNNYFETLATSAQTNISEGNDNNYNEIMSTLDEMDNQWQKIRKNLAYYVEHDELEKVDTSIVVFKEDLKLKEYEEAIPEIKKCIFIMEHIKDKGIFKVINLF